VFRGECGRPFQPQSVAYRAARGHFRLLANAPQKKIQPVFVNHYQRQFFVRGKRVKSVTPAAVLG